MTTVTQLTEKRDAKAMPHLAQYAPVWILQEQVFVEEEAVQFHALFQHHLHGWVDRRYRYDAFNDTLYHKGQTLVHENDALEMTLENPYIDAQVVDIPNAYGG